ncbi:MAG TPA: hypothetical protein VIY73_04805 [Polyangiaceae bacterium]
MSTRRSRPSRARKARSSEAPQTDVAVAPSKAASVEQLEQLARAVDPTETSQLRALEAGWDELLT